MERYEYAYLLCVGKNLKKVIAKSWWSTRQEMELYKCAMNAAAMAFRRTYSVLVYQHTGDDVWIFVSSIDAHAVSIPAKINIMDYLEK